jgi:hypothetical protein
MRVRLSCGAQGCKLALLLLPAKRRVVLAMLAWLAMIGTSLYAQESTPPGKHVQKLAAQQKLATREDTKTRSTKNPDPESCTLTSGDYAIATKTGRRAELERNADQDVMSPASGQSLSTETFSLKPPPQEKWLKDQIHVDEETTSKQESRGEEPGNSDRGSDRQCTQHGPSPKIPVPN